MIQEYSHATEELTPNALGRKSEKTRRRIMEATKTLFSQGKYAAKITDIARAAKIAQPHFYIYFSSVHDVVYAIADEMYRTSSGKFVSSLESDWTGEEGFLLAREAVETAIARWRENYGINTICSLLADKEEGRFRDLRKWREQFLCDIFAEKVRSSQRLGRLDSNIDPMLRGYQCIDIMMNTAQRYDFLITSGFVEQKIFDETAYLLLSALGLGK